MEYQWWSKDKKALADSVHEYLKFLDNDQSYRQAENVKFMRLYGNSDFAYLRNYEATRTEAAGPSIQSRVTLNIIQSMVDTVVSKIAKNRPKPMFLTEGGDWSQQRRAKKLSQFLEGQFDACDFYAKAARAFLDSCIFGTGALKIFKSGAEIKVERVFIDEIKVDDRESIYGEPRQLHQEKLIHKDVLKEMFPKKADLIESAISDPNVYSYGTNKAAKEMICVRESWHLPSGEGAGDGKHALTMKGLNLFEEEYEKHYFPFVFWRWGLRPLGFFGQGLAEQLQGLQLEINKILRTIQVSMHLVSVPKLFVEYGSKIVDAHLDNRIGSIIRYNGQVPTPGQLGVIPPELFSHLDRLYQRAYEIAGVSQLSATSAKPAGLNSGKALREYNDLETERFMSVAQRYEKAFLDAVPMMIDLAKEIDEELEEDGGYKVKVKGKKFLKTIKWHEVSMEEDQYSMSVFPISALSSTPAARLAEVQELISAGFVTREDAIKLLDYPDLQSFYNLETAPGEDIDMVIEKAMDDGEYMTPEPYQNLEFGIQKMQKAYLLFRSQNAPEERLELLRRWIEDAYALIQRAAVKGQSAQIQAQAGLQQVAAQDAEAALPPDEVVPAVNGMPI